MILSNTFSGNQKSTPGAGGFCFPVVCGENERRSVFAVQFNKIKKQNKTKQNKTKKQKKPSDTQSTNKGEFEEELTRERREKLINAINLARKITVLNWTL